MAKKETKKSTQKKTITKRSVRKAKTTKGEKEIMLSKSDSNKMRRSTQFEKPANTIVLFYESTENETEKNLRVLADTLKVKETSNYGQRQSIKVFDSKNEGQARQRYFGHLGAAAIDATPDEIVNLRKQSNVLGVFPNEERRLIADNFRTQDFRTQDFRTQDFRTQANRQCIEAYLQGMKDAAEAGLIYLKPPETAQSSSQTTAEVEIDGFTWGLQRIGITPNYTGPTGEGITIAVLDTGVLLNHPDLVAKFPNPELNTASFVPHQRVDDGDGHGTHCAGTIAGPVNSISGIRYGVAPNVNLLIGKVLSNEGSGFDSQIINGMDWAAENGADIISMSLGSFRNRFAPFSSSYERIANTLLEREDVLTIAAAGNDSNRPKVINPVNNPAACPSIMAVGATDFEDQIAGFSNGQRDPIGEINIAAPGVDIFSSWKDGDFKVIDGTSMATPHVAGLAALIKEHLGLSAREIWNELQSTAIALGNRNDFGHGLIQVP